MDWEPTLGDQVLLESRRLKEFRELLLNPLNIQKLLCSKAWLSEPPYSESVL